MIILIANIILEMDNGFSVKCWPRAGVDKGAGGAPPVIFAKKKKGKEKRERKKREEKRGRKEDV